MADGQSKRRLGFETRYTVLEDILQEVLQKKETTEQNWGNLEEVFTDLLAKFSSMDRDKIGKEETIAALILWVGKLTCELSIELSEMHKKIIKIENKLKNKAQ